MNTAPDFQHSSFSGVIGVSRKDITPPIGIYMGNWGAAKQHISSGVHLPLTLTCITFQTDFDSKPTVLIAADLGWWKNGPDEKNLRFGILDALKIDSANLLFCLSHTHAGPSICSLDEDKEGGEMVVPYLQLLQEKAIEAIKEATYTASQSTLEWSYGKCNLAINRDLFEEKNNRDVVGFNPLGAVDDTLLVGRITSSQGKILATIVNYACHPTTLAWENELISPDYLGAMRNLVEQKTGSPCAFLQGASGELSPPEQFTGDTHLADRYGEVLGYAVLSILANMIPTGKKLVFSSIVESGAPLAIWKNKAAKISNVLSAQEVMIHFTLKDLPSALEIENEIRVTSDKVEKERLIRKLGIRKTLGNENITQVPLWIWKLGSALIVAQPNEAYSYFQQELRKSFPKNAIAVVNVANGHIGYLPPKYNYTKNSYPVWQTPFAGGSLELLTQEAIHASAKALTDES